MFVIVSDNPDEIISVLQHLAGPVTTPKGDDTVPHDEIVEDGKSPTRGEVLRVIQKHGPMPYSDLKGFFPHKGGRLRALLATMKGKAFKEGDLWMTYSQYSRSLKTA